MKPIEDRMIAYAEQDDYHVTQNLLIQGANEIIRLRKELALRISPCNGHAFEPENNCTSCCGCNDGCLGI